MRTISVHQFCIHYNVPQSFIDSLSSFELIDLVEIDTDKHIYFNDINKIEKFIRIHYELNVNYEGIDIINNLMEQINRLQGDINILKNRLDFYE